MASRMTVSCRSLSSVSMSLTNMVSGSSTLSSLLVSSSGHRSGCRDSASDWTICFPGTWISLMSYSERVRCHLASSVQFLSCFEIHEVFVVGENCGRVLGSLQVVLPLVSAQMIAVIYHFH